MRRELKVTWTIGVGGLYKSFSSCPDEEGTESPGLGGEAQLQPLFQQLSR